MFVLTCWVLLTIPSCIDVYVRAVDSMVFPEVCTVWWFIIHSYAICVYAPLTHRWSTYVRRSNTEFPMESERSYTKLRHHSAMLYHMLSYSISSVIKQHHTRGDITERRGVSCLLPHACDWWWSLCTLVVYSILFAHTYTRKCYHQCVHNN